MVIIIREPGAGEEFEQYLDLRWRILRAPWGQPRGSETDAQDTNAIHLAVYGGDDGLLACGRVHSETGQDARIRYMAVEAHARGKGIGGQLLQALEQRAHASGATRMVLDARESAVEFYRHFGYEVQGRSHTLFGEIPHVRMSKELQGSG